MPTSRPDGGVFTVDANAATRAGAVSVGAPVPKGMVCASCGYLLDGLKTDDPCPECAYPVMRSVRGDLLRWAPVEWVARVVRGLMFLKYAARAITVAVITLVVTIIAGLLMASAGGAAAVQYVIWGLSAVFLIAVGVGLILLPVGAVLATSPQGTQNSAAERNLMLARASGVLVPFAVVFSYVGLNPLSGALAAVLVERAVVQGVCFGFLLALYRLLRDLSKRVATPERERVRLVRSAHSTLVLSGVLFFLVGWVPPLLSALGAGIPVIAGQGANGSTLALIAVASMLGLIARLADDGKLERALARERSGEAGAASVPKGGAATTTLGHAP